FDADQKARVAANFAAGLSGVTDCAIVERQLALFDKVSKELADAIRANLAK
ncbi:catalase, partial [Pasteurella multocida subsp. gallicida str. Anand1_poultry]